jgi:hypothetical protein
MLPTKLVHLAICVVVNVNERRKVGLLLPMEDVYLFQNEDIVQK